MSEVTRGPEAKTPYDQAIDDFYAMLKNSSATQSTIRLNVANVLSHATPASMEPDLRQKYIDNWAQRHEFDVDGILVDAGGPVEYDEDGDAYESDTDKIISHKLRLIADMTSFLIASEYSLLANDQKTRLLDRAYRYFEDKLPEIANRSLTRQMDSVLGKAVAPYIAVDIERAELGDDREVRVRRGKFALGLLERHNLIRNDRRYKLNRNLNRAKRN